MRSFSLAISSCRPSAAPLLLAAAVVGLTGCVRRTLHITSDPPGALVWLNDREIGRTPVDVDFVHYGTYDVRLVKDGYESMLTFGDAKPPWWDNVGPDLFAEMVPGAESNVRWHYTLEPTSAPPEVLRAEIVERARETRAMLAADSPPDSPPDGPPDGRPDPAAEPPDDE